MTPGLGFLVGWTSLMDYLLLPMVNALILRSYMEALFPDIPGWVWVVAFTAGHCAELAGKARPGRSPVARYLTSGGGSTPFGEYIKATRSTRGQDIAIIQVVGADVAPIAQSIGPVRGVSSTEELRELLPGLQHGLVDGQRRGLVVAGEHALDLDLADGAAPHAARRQRLGRRRERLGRHPLAAVRIEHVREPTA